MEYYLQQEVIAGRIYTFPDNKYVSIWITDNPFSSGHGESPYFKVKYKEKLVSVSLPDFKILHTVDKDMKAAMEMALAFAATRVEILESRFNDAVNGRIPAPIE